MTLEKERIQVFVHDLETCNFKSDFDSGFLTTPLQSLYAYNKNKWLSIFQERQKTLLGSSYDWTHSSLDPKEHWSLYQDHANYHWYALAKVIAELYQLSVTDVIFPSIEISNKVKLGLIDRPKNYEDLYYNDSYTRLMSLSLIFKRLSEDDFQQFGSYNQKGELYPLSFDEAIQIQNKTQLSIRSEKTYWQEICDKHIPNWTNPSNFYIDDLIYPLFNLVQAYFKALEDETSSDGIRNLLQLMYEDELKSLKNVEANYFYGQKIPNFDHKEITYVLIEILTDIKRYQLDEILPKMVALAVWITEKNPAMLTEHPDVDLIYKRKELGPYFTREKLRSELYILQRSRKSLEDEEMSMIEELIKLSNSDIPDSMLFKGSKSNSNSIQALFLNRDAYNKTHSSPDHPCEYLYQRRGINQQFIRIAQYLQGSGFLEQQGIEDYFLLLMPTLKTSFDPVSGEFWSTRPFSHYVWPENDRTYLIGLFNSANNYAAENNCFYNANAVPRRALTVKEYKHVKSYAAKKFAHFPRVPEHIMYRLRASTLQSLVNLVNETFDYSGLEDNYHLKEGIPNNSQLNSKCIYFKRIIERNTVVYKVRDSWVNGIREGEISFDSIEAFKEFSNFNTYQKLHYILDITSNNHHTHPDYSKSRFHEICKAYTKFREFYYELPNGERENLNKVAIIFHNDTVRMFSEIWLGGNPKCLASASKWFAILILNYLPNLKFCKYIENYPKDPTKTLYLVDARKNSQNLYRKDMIINDICDPEKDLNEVLTYRESNGTDLAGTVISWVSWSLGIFSPPQETYTDSPGETDTEEESVDLTPNVSCK
ncbi:MAG: hypothetical protein CK424_01660 [Legionella sp.]|nr:MAG: hypothetical protein CK424_01660 [Legionella sp.]